MVKTRRSFNAAQKAEVVRRHLVGKEAVSALAEELQVQPSQVHLWVKQVLEQAEKAFDRDRSGRLKGIVESRKDQRIAELEEKLARKNEVISELMEANVQATKANGGLCKELGSPTTHATQLSTTSRTGRIGRRSGPTACWAGWA